MTRSAKGTIHVNCNLCGQDNGQTLYDVAVRDDQKGVFERDVWPIVRCKNCGLIYTNPRLDDEALAVYYSFENEQDAAYIQNWFIESADLQRPTWQRYLRVMQAHRENGRLIDVGCGAGSFMVEAQKMGYEVMGQEVAPYFVEYCRDHHKLNVLEGELDELPLEPNTFDVATAFDVIEHHPAPRRMLTAMHNLLRPGGLIVVGTHDIGNFYARLYGKKWRYINPIGHLTYFSRRTLVALLADCGFETVQHGGIHTIDHSKLAEWRNKLVQFLRVIVLRALILGIYKPLAAAWPRLTKWQVKLGTATLNHDKLLVRAGSQIVMDDNIICLAVAKK